MWISQRSLCSLAEDLLEVTRRAWFSVGVVMDEDTESVAEVTGRRVSHLVVEDNVLTTPRPLEFNVGAGTYDVMIISATPAGPPIDFTLLTPRVFNFYTRRYACGGLTFTSAGVIVIHPHWVIS